MDTIHQRMVSGSLKSYLAETETWKALHDETAACLDFEELVSLGNSTFDGIDRWDTIWHEKVNSGSTTYNVKHEESILQLYKVWLMPSRAILDRIAQFESMDYEVTGAETFRRNCEDAIGILTNEDEFFGDELISRQEEALAADLNGETVPFEEMGH